MANNLIKAITAKLSPPEEEEAIKRVEIKCDPADVQGSVLTPIQASLRQRGGLYAHAGNFAEIRPRRAITVAEQQSDCAGMEIHHLKGPALVAHIEASFQALWFRKNTWQKGRFNPVDIAMLESTGGGNQPTLTGIRSTPLVCLDGRIVDAPGYDGETGLFFDIEPDHFPKLRRYLCYQKPIPKNWLNGLRALDISPVEAEHAARQFERERNLAEKQAAAALAYLTDEVFAEFPFRGEVDAHAAVAALLTALVRQVLDVAPGFLFGASQQASGKTELMKLVGRVVEGTAPAMNQWSMQIEERQKGIFSALLAGRQYLMFDNLRDGAKLDCPIIAQLVTTGVMEGRKLGASEMKQLPAAVFLAFSGNNITLADDMSSRVIEVYLDAGMERPDTRSFRRDLGRWIDEHRPEIVEAALKIIVAYLDAGVPAMPSKASRFPQWDCMVRFPIMFAGGEDIAAAFDRAHDADPTRELLREMLAAWRSANGDKALTSSEILDAIGGEFSPQYDHFREALQALAGDGRRLQLSAKALGQHLKRFVNRTLDGMTLRSNYDSNRKIWRWFVEAG
jgi:hypothetical protein